MTSGRDGAGSATSTWLDGFYAVLDRDDETLARQLVGLGGAKILQVRIKPAAGSSPGARPDDVAALVRIIAMARRVCNEVGALVVVNDRIDVALATGADAVHLGQTDLPLADARAIVGARLRIGVSTHDLAQVRAACAGGADYLGYGPVFVTRTKQSPDRVQGLEALRAAVVLAGTCPVVAIGGITADQVAAVYATGVAAICAISAVNDALDVGVAARAMCR